METTVEARLRNLEERTSRLEALLGASQPAPRPQPAPAAAQPAPRDEPPVAIDLEELLGGRILGWIGGIAIVLGIGFFLALAINHGWIDEPTRVVLAFLASSALFAAALWLYERAGRTQASLAAMGAAIGGLYASDTAATALYHLVGDELGLVVAGLIGAAATVVAIRWDSRVVAGIGIVGALLAPVLVNAGTNGASLAFVTVASIAAVGVLTWRRWSWLAGIAYLVTLPQLADWIDATRGHHQARVLVVLFLFWTLYVLAALGAELREPTNELRTSSALLLLANGAATAAIGWGVLHDGDNDIAANTWLLAFAAAHVALGIAGRRTRVSDEIGALLVSIGAGLAAIGMALALDGPALVAGWAVEAVVLALAARRTSDERGHVAAAAFLFLAGGHVLVFDAQPSALAFGVDSLATAAVGLLLVAGAALACAYAARELDTGWSRVLAGFAAVAIVYLGSVAVVDLAGAREDASTQSSRLLLSAYWAVTALAALVVGLLRNVRALRLGGFALLGVAVAKVFLVDLATLESAYRVISLLALGLLSLAGAFAYQRVTAKTS